MNKFIITLLFISLVIYWRWLSFDIFVEGDWGYRFFESSLETGIISPWENYGSLGNINVALWRLPFHFFESIFGNFGFGWNISEKFLVMWPVIFFFPLVIFLLLRKIRFSRKASFVGSLFFIFNSYFLAIHTQGHIPLAIAGVWGVFSLYFLFHLVEKKRVEWAILAGMMLALAGYYDFRMAYIFFFVCVGFLFFSWLGEVRRGIFLLSPRAKSRGLFLFFGRGRDFSASVEMTERKGVEMTEEGILDLRLRGGEEVCGEMLDPRLHGGEEEGGEMLDPRLHGGEEEGGEMLDPRLHGGEKRGGGGEGGGGGILDPRLRGGGERSRGKEVCGGILDPRLHGGKIGNAGGEKVCGGEGARDIFWMSGVFVAVFVGLNIFWVLPFAVSGSLGDNAGVGRSLFGNSYFELDDAMYLSHPFWTGYGVKWFSDQPTPWWLSLLAILAWVGFWVGIFPRHREALRSDPETGGKGEISRLGDSLEMTEDKVEMKKRRYILFFALVALVGILLGKQVSDPFPTLYNWLYETLPGFNAFREASKFYVLIALGYAVGIASLVEWLLPSSHSCKKK